MNILLRNPRRTVEVEGAPAVIARLTERETAAWCVLGGIDYQVEECPLAAGNRHLDHKALLLNGLEARPPGAKAAFYLNFLEHMAPLRTRVAVVESPEGCARCGSPTTGELCAFCTLVEVAAAHDPIPVEMMRRAKARR